MFKPAYSISKATARHLMEIEAVRRELGDFAIPPETLASLRESAALNTAHFSTQIEGNRLTFPEVEAVRHGGARFPGRERDAREVKNHFAAHAYMERIAAKDQTVSEREIQTLHGLVFLGKEKPTPWRNQQNVIRESASGRIVYLPPEAGDVPRFMQEMVAFIQKEISDEETPVPIVAALAHYQFATIHPYIDGNGRTARLLANLILQRTGYGLSGIYSLDEHYAGNLNAYYGALSIGSHNYYEGRVEADITGFVDYFIAGMAEAFSKIRLAAKRAVAQASPALPNPLLRELDLKQRKLLPFLQQHHSATTAELAAALKLSQRTLLALCREWVEQGFLELENPSRKARAYRLGKRYAVVRETRTLQGQRAGRKKETRE